MHLLSLKNLRELRRTDRKRVVEKFVNDIANSATEFALGEDWTDLRTTKTDIGSYIQHPILQQFPNVTQQLAKGII